MIKVVEFRGFQEAYKSKHDRTPLEQLNEYLALNDKGIDLIEVQTHVDRFVLIYRQRNENEIKYLIEQYGEKFSN